MLSLTSAILISLSLLLTPQEHSDYLGPSDLVITKKSWNKFYLPVGGDRDPFAPNDLVRAETRAARDAASVNRQGGRVGDGPVKPQTYHIGTSSLNDLKSGTAYSYTLKIRNAGTKTIRSLVWAYVFVDSHTLDEVGRNVFVHTVKIGPGKNDKLVGYSNTPPARVINVKRIESNVVLSEKIEIYQIKYNDGSVWERAAATTP
jgi:hypothetical protein